MIPARAAGHLAVSAVAEPPRARPMSMRLDGTARPEHPSYAWSPAAEELLETLVRLEPGARLVRLGRGERDAARGAQRVFLPDAQEPVLLTSAHPRAIARAQRRVDSTTTLGDAAGMVGSTAWTRLTRGTLQRDRVALVGGTGGLGEHLSEVLGQSVTYAVRVDQARISRRPALQVFDVRGRLVAHAALGVSSASRRDLAVKAEALGVVGAREWQHLEVPEVLGSSTWGDVEVLLTRALATPLRQGWRRRDEPPLEAMSELSRAWEGESVRLDEMGWVRRQQQLAADLSSRAARQRLGAAIERLLTDARRTTWPTGAWHGDWTPRHMARRGSRVQLWSWARFETDVPMGLDPCHWVVDAVTRRDGLTPATVHAGVREALHRQHGPGASVLGALYLLAVTGRELLMAEGPGGDRVADRAEVLLASLEGWFDRRR